MQEYTSPQNLLSTSQGNMQLLPNANVFIGWGSAPFISEFSHDGKLLYDAAFPPDGESYRAFRFSWNGHPIDEPSMAMEQGPEGRVKLYTSWNGATEFDSWEVLAGPHPHELEPLGSVPRDGFETVMWVQTSDSYLAVRAKDHSGRILGTSAPVKR